MASKFSKQITGTTPPKRSEMYPGKPSQPSRQTQQYGTGSAKDNMTYDIRGSGKSVGRLEKSGTYKTPISRGKGNPQKDMTSTGMGKRKVVSTRLEQS